MARSMSREGSAIKKRGGMSNVPRDLLPEVPFRAPAGSYDVGLDAAERASNRGLQDLLNDLNRDQERADVQGGWGREDITRGRDESLSDLDTRNTRFTRDLGTARQRGGEDYQSGLANLARNYQRLGNSQRQGATVAGVQRGGALKQAARKRDENMAWDRKPMDTNYARQQQDWNNSESDWGQDYQTTRGRITTGADRDLGRLNVAGSWDAQDRLTQGTRAQRENQYFGQDTQATRVQQVQQTSPGWLSDWQSRNKNRGWRQF